MMRRHPIARILSPLLFVLSLSALSPPAAAQCVAGRFFVSTQVPGFFPALAPPAGFCVVDNGAGDSNPSSGVIDFSQTVNSPVFGVKQFSGRAEIVPGTATTGGRTGFGVKLSNLVETTLSTPAGIVPGTPVFVQATFNPDIPSGSYAAVTTSISGSASVSGGNFLINDIGSWSGVPVVSSLHAIPVVAPGGSFAPASVTSLSAAGLPRPEQVTYEYSSTARQTGTQVTVNAGSAIVDVVANATECTVGKFFVSTFVENFFPNLLPPVGFCIPDNGVGDMDPVAGSIVFDQTVTAPASGAVKRFNGHALNIPGAPAVGGPGTTGFGVRLTDFQEDTLGVTSTVGLSGIPIFVQNTYSPGIPNNGNGRVTTSLDGFVQNSNTFFSIADLGSWAGVPVVSSGHILAAPPYVFSPASITSPVGAGARGTEVVTYQFIDTNRQTGTSVILPGSGQAIVDESAGLPVPQFLGLQPQVAVNPVGGRHTVVANLNPAVAGVQVTFTVTAGPNAGTTGTAVTDVFGNAVFTYPDNGGQGTDTIQATAPGGLASNLVKKDWVPDRNQPICRLNRTGAGFIEILVDDLLSGLAAIEVRVANNAAVGVPGFAVGSTLPLLVRADKLDGSQPSQVGLRVTDVAGNVIDCDPVQVSVERTTGRPQPVTLTGLPAEESRITVRNGSPGLKNLEIEVNGRTWRLAGLADGAERTLDVSSAMRPGDGNTITVTPQGKPGGSADLVISD